MTNINSTTPPTDNRLYPQENLKTAPPSTSEYFIKDGKKYKVTIQTIQHNLPWKVWQGVQAFFLTVFSFGIGFAFQSFRNAWKEKWNQAVTGEEKIPVYTRYSIDENLQTTKINRLGSSLAPAIEPKLQNDIKPLKSDHQENILKSSIELPLEVRNFIQQARKDITKISFADLEHGLREALKSAPNINNPEDKTTLYTIAERVAQYHISNLSYDKAFNIRIEVARTIQPGAPLANLHIALQHADPKLGVKLYPVDTSLFKNHSLGLQKRKFTDGSTRLHLNAKLSHPARTNLNRTLDAMRPVPDLLLNALPSGFCKSVKMYTEDSFYEGRTDGAKKWEGDFSSNPSHGYTIKDYGDTCKSQVVEFEGVGKVKIATSNFRAEYNRISIDLDPNISEAEATDKLNIIFAALGLGAVSSSSRTEDIERIKVLQLLRAFYPNRAYEFERNANSFEQSVESLKASICHKVPAMKNKFQEYLVDHPEKMYQQEVYPGQFVWCVKGLSAEVRKKGGIGLTAGVTANNFNDATNRLISMLKGGALSSQDRFELGIIAAGDSSGTDIKSGGGDSVFVRMITRSMSKDLSSYPLSGQLHILYDLDLVERVGYVYGSDQYGTKEESVYKTRKNVVEITSEIEASPITHMSNEICIHHRVGPEFIKGINVKTQHEKEQLINALRAEGLITKKGLNQEFFNNIPLDQFIRIGVAKEAYWA